MGVHFVSPNPPVSGRTGGQTPVNILDDLMPMGGESTAIRQGLKWDYAQLGEAGAGVREHAVRIKLAERRASEAIIEAGQHLLAVKDVLSHGQWGDWLETEFAMSDRTARRMMEVATKFVAKTDTVSVLNPSVLYMIAGDSVPEAARNEVIQRAQGGEKVTKATAKAVIEASKPKAESPVMNTAAPSFAAPPSPDAICNSIDTLYWEAAPSERNASRVDHLMAPGNFDYYVRGVQKRLGFPVNGHAVTNAIMELVARLKQEAAEEAPNTQSPIAQSPIANLQSSVSSDAPTHGQLAAKHAIWKYLVTQCGTGNFKAMVEFGEALHYREASHPNWFQMYPQGADIDDVFWALETCIDQAAALVPEYAQQAAEPVRYAPVVNLQAAVLKWVRAHYAEWEEAVASLEGMLADPQHNEDVQWMRPTLPGPYRQEDLLAAIEKALAHLRLLDEEEPEGRNAEAETLTGADLGVMQTAPGGVLNVPMPNWEAGRQADPAPAHELDCYDDALAAPAARRMNRLHTLKVRFEQTIDLFPEFGELTGRHSETLAAKRALQQLIELLDDEMDALTAKEVGRRG